MRSETTSEDAVFCLIMPNRLNTHLLKRIQLERIDSYLYGVMVRMQVREQAMAFIEICGKQIGIAPRNSFFFCRGNPSYNQGSPSCRSLFRVIIDMRKPREEVDCRKNKPPSEKEHIWILIKGRETWMMRL